MLDNTHLSKRSTLTTQKNVALHETSHKDCLEVLLLYLSEEESESLILRGTLKKTLSQDDTKSH